MDLFREFKLDQSVFQEKHFLLILDKVKKDGEVPKKEAHDGHGCCLHDMTKHRNYQYMALKNKMKQLIGLF